MKKKIAVMFMTALMMLSMFSTTGLAACKTYKQCPTCGYTSYKDITYKRVSCKKKKPWFGSQYYLDEQHVTKKCNGQYSKKNWLGRYKTYNCSKKYLYQCNTAKHTSKYNHVY